MSLRSGLSLSLCLLLCWSGQQLAAAQQVYQTQDKRVDYVGSSLDAQYPPQESYLRCKLTHRCNRASVDYDLVNSILEFRKDNVWNGANTQVLSDTLAAELWVNFENWRSGTIGWTVDQAFLNGTLNSTIGAHFNSFEPDVTLNAPLDLRTFSPYELALNDTYELLINTTDATARLYNDTLFMDEPDFEWPPEDLSLRVPERNFTGNLLTTSTGDTEVAVLSFLAIYWGPQLRVNITGDRPLVLISRSTLYIDTTVTIPHGELGGMPGVDTWAPEQNNQHGPGSPALRVYWNTLSVFGDDVDEVQSVTIGADQGQTLRGYFRLIYTSIDGLEFSTQPIPHDADNVVVRRAIEDNIPLAGDVAVTRTARDDEGGRTWTITFLTAVGDLPQIRVVDELTGIGHHAFTNTIQDGNTIGGHVQLEFLGDVTRNISVNASAAEVQAILEEDLSNVINAEVTRSNPTDLRCQAGHCANGPQEAWGLTWSFTLVSDTDIVEPTSPNDAHPTLQDSIAPIHPVIYSRSVVSSVPWASAGARLINGFDSSQALGLPPHNVSSPVTIPYGGFGASYGGIGGAGHARHNSKPIYNDEVQTDLLGGSGGAMGAETVHQILAATTHTYVSNKTGSVGTAAGGNGGGVLELVAVNDVLFGLNAYVTADGQDGQDGWRAGGGGSGGGIVVSAGGVVVNHGYVSTKGGAGGRGIGLGSRGGGGGGGGRITGFSQSLATDDGGIFDVSGGRGGLDQELANLSRIDDGDYVIPRNILYSGDDRSQRMLDGGEGVLHMISASGAQYRIGLTGGGAEGTPKALRLEANETILNENNVVVRSPYANNGPSFTFPARNSGTWHLRRGQQSPEIGEGGSGVHGGKNFGVNPRRVTVYVKVDFPSYGNLNNLWGAHIALHEFDYRPISNDTGVQNRPQEGNLPGGTGGNGAGGAGSAGGGGVPGDGGEGGGVGNDAAALIGVAMIDGKFKHDSNYRHNPGVDLHPESPQTVGFRHVEPDRWYKVDIFMDWQNKTYKVRIDDYTVALDQPFNGSRISRIGLYTYHQAVVWFDEIYVGPEDTMNFECPQTRKDQHLKMQRPVQSGWDLSEMGPATSLYFEQRHESHIAEREMFQRVPRQLGVEVGDGSAHEQFHSDLITRTPTGDHDPVDGQVMGGALNWVPVGRHADIWEHDFANKDFRARANTIDNPGGSWGAGARLGPGADNHGETGRFYWYGEHDVDTDQLGFENYALELSDERIQGGIFSCSTDDMLSWRNEGTMLHWPEMLDTSDPFSAPVSLRSERPKVLWNEAAQQYVMWMAADDYDQSLRVVGLAVSEFPNGPFSFARTFLPDNNRTVDFTVFQDVDGTAFLARTFYANKSYLLPANIMQPMWESVKTEESTAFDPVVDFRLSYHRAFYHHLYDNVEDTYIQRWRMEDREWRIETGNWIETYNQDEEVFYLHNAETGEPHLLSTSGYSPSDRMLVLEQALDDHTFRNISGQGRPPILSRFKRPESPLNNAWSPDSVPAVKAQSWEQNYLDKNIADNPLHPTVADLLIGPEQVVVVRRAKYLSVSRISDDYLSSDGVLMQIEGELENQDDLIVMLQEFGRFGWTAGDPGTDPDNFITTYPFPEFGRAEPFRFVTLQDWEWRHWQWNNTFNDRYNVEGTLPEDAEVTHTDFVNFRDEQVSDECPLLHYQAETKYNECEDLRRAQMRVNLPPQVNHNQELQSYARAMSTAAYEACLVEHEEARLRYEECVRAQLVDFDTLQPWGVGQRECVGGDGPCTRD